MLTAYFDDSGTHAGSHVVVYGGFIARDEVWADLETEWRPLLRHYGLSAFHLAHCEAGDHEFDLWPRAKRDMVLYEFRQLVLNRDIWGISIAVSRADWDELVVGIARNFAGEADEFCARMCIYDALQFTTVDETERQVAVVFDDRPHRSVDILRMARPFLEQGLDGMELASVTFGKMKQIIPLQAADMLAWEAYTNAKQWLELGRTPTDVRPHFKRMLDRGGIRGGIAGREVIKQMVPIAANAGSLITVLEAIAVAEARSGNG